jgi:chromate transporter
LFGIEKIYFFILETKKNRHFIFLKDVLILSLTCFGGPQAHLALFIKKLVHQRRYLSEEELMEMLSLCQLLPGPTSTQTITAIGFKLGGPRLSYLTLLIWILPATLFMGITALGISFFERSTLIKLTQFIKPMGVAFIFFAAFLIGRKVITSKTSVWLMILAAVLGFLYPSPYLTPFVILFGGLVASFKYRKHQKMKKKPIRIQWSNFILWAVVFAFVIFLGTITQSLPIRLFENFYRNGSFAFGGGHILKPLLYNEFVEFKHYLSADEFLSGIAIAELVPGPTFSIASYVGSLSMRSWGVSGQILGSLVASIGIFLPGIFMIFFVIRFWEQLKQFRGIRASLEGINASSIGLTVAAGVSLSQPLISNPINIITVLLTLLILYFEKVPSYLIILGGICLGAFF